MEQQNWLKFEGKGDPPGDPKESEGYKVHDGSGAHAFCIKTVKHVHVKTHAGGRGAFSGNEAGGDIRSKEQENKVGAYGLDGTMLFSQNWISEKQTTETYGEPGGTITGTYQCTWAKGDKAYTTILYDDRKCRLYEGKLTAKPPEKTPNVAELQLLGSGIMGAGQVAKFGLPPFSAQLSPEVASVMTPALVIFLLVYGQDTGRKFHGVTPASAAGGVGGGGA